MSGYDQTLREFLQVLGALTAVIAIGAAVLAYGYHTVGQDLRQCQEQLEARE